MRKFYEEFKNFAIKGNMIDLAVGIIIGTAFNKVVSTIVSAVIMPPLSLLTDDVNLSNKKWVLREAADSVEEVAIGYGELIESLLDFGIIAFTIFVMVKFINRFKEKSEDPANKEVETPKNIALLSSMEQLLKEQNAILKNKK
ncbi:large conductance mechanosensitive channel [Maribacter caenipelagi]|uniref:Large-conductance mechanosensitive channel n=1 Tax=Maribacter caenipelagi TaxID=1447781 RepID=A0A4V3E3F7_9FLAO|nr:large-conductance mechanosensitive channel protein MscL [Maribacter caenipelagi]TDS20798.1 large conductance mechanosensitive channel [Maribacter caenipelagi]